MPSRPIVCRLVCLGLLLASTFYLPGQSQPAPLNHTVSAKRVFFYTVNWELTTPEKSFYRREAGFDFEAMVFDGVYKDYNKEDKLIAEGFYMQGEKRGLQTEYFSDRSLKSTIEFTNRDFTIWELHNDSREVLVKSGSGKFSLGYLYVSGLVSQPVWKRGTVDGEFQFGRRSGTWLYHDINGVQTDTEVYENGKLIKRLHYIDGQSQDLDYSKEILIAVNTLLVDAYVFDHDAFQSLNEAFQKTLIYPEGFSRNVTYPGGIKKLLVLLAGAADIPEGHVAVLKIKVDASGKVIKTKVENTDDPQIKTRALNALKTYESRLLPAIKNGKPQTSWIYIPVSGGQEWTDLISKAPQEELIQTNNTSGSYNLLNLVGLAAALLLLVLTFL